MPFNSTRAQMFALFINEEPPGIFAHTPPDNKPAQPTLPGGLTEQEVVALVRWRVSDSVYYGYYGGSTKDFLYNQLSAAAKVKANAFIVFDKMNRAWLTTDRLARLSQWAWARADAAISNYNAVPQTATLTLTGGFAPASPQTKQEP